MIDYLWFKALHVAVVVIWVGGVLLNGVVLSLLARDPGGLSHPGLERLHHWDRWVTNTAQGLVWIFGIVLIVMGGWFPDGWLLVKLAFVIFIAAIHGVQSASLRKLAAGKEITTRMALVRQSAYWVIGAIFAIAFMVVLKPF